MDYTSAEQTNLDMLLTQIGAKVKSLHGLICFVEFYINDTRLLYIYNLNAKEQYALQRILPYPIGAGVFSSPEEVVGYIKEDIRQFKNASNSKTFDAFIETGMKLHQTVHEMEDVFMHYNVPLDKLQEIQDELERIKSVLNEIKNTSDKIVL